MSVVLLELLINIILMLALLLLLLLMMMITYMLRAGKISAAVRRRYPRLD